MPVIIARKNLLLYDHYSHPLGRLNIFIYPKYNLQLNILPVGHHG